MQKTILVTGAAGFIGSYLVDKLLCQGNKVIGVDNFVRGIKTNLSKALANPNFTLIELNLTNYAIYLKQVSQLHNINNISQVWHMAANSDIAAGVSNPDIDYNDTFMTTYNTLKLMKELHIKSIAFASSSAIYGVHELAIFEDIGPILPISNYGAMKLASEAIISAAVESFLDIAYIFRFPNIIGARATHGIIYDLCHKLIKDTTQLEVLGDGNQRKQYLHVIELIDAMLYITTHAYNKLNYYNIGTLDQGVTVKQIAQCVLQHSYPTAKINYTGGAKGWVGDIPRFEYSVDKLTKLGWQPKLSSYEALEKSVIEITKEILA